MPKTKPSALPISGKVTARSQFGIQIEDMPEVWLNWSKEEYRKEPWEADDVQKGDWVNMEVSGKYIKSIALTEPPTGERMVNELDEGPFPEDAFEGMEAGGEKDPGEPARRNPIIATDRDRSIQKQVALKCAVELAIGMLGPMPEGQRAGPVNAAYVVSLYKQFRDALKE